MQERSETGFIQFKNVGGANIKHENREEAFKDRRLGLSSDCMVTTNITEENCEKRILLFIERAECFCS